MAGGTTGGSKAFVDTRGTSNLTGGLPLFDRSLWSEALREMMGSAKDDMQAGVPRTRAEVLKSIVRPLLSHLGWDFADAGRVVSGFETGSGTADLALCHPRGKPMVLVKIGSPSDVFCQVGSHPFNHHTIKAMLLTISKDGRVWSFHFPSGRGSLRNREFARFDIISDPEKQVAESIEGYLAVYAVKSGEAFQKAEQEYIEKRFPADAPAAWRRALRGSEVLQRFLEEIEEAAGVLPDQERAEEFIQGQLAVVQWPADPPDPSPTRRVALGDRVWVYDFASRDLVSYRLIQENQEWKEGEVSVDSPFGQALLGAREGEERQLTLPGRKPTPLRIVLIRPTKP